MPAERRLQARCSAAAIQTGNGGIVGSGANFLSHGGAPYLGSRFTAGARLMQHQRFARLAFFISATPCARLMGVDHLQKSGCSAFVST